MSQTRDIKSMLILLSLHFECVLASKVKIKLSKKKKKNTKTKNISVIKIRDKFLTN